MASPVKPRDVTPIISMLRNFCGQRKLRSVHRFEDYISPRSGPKPSLPPGVSHALSSNFYFNRDGRRSLEPEKLVYDAKALPSGEKKPAELSTTKILPKPGFGYNWDTGAAEYKP